MNKMGVRVVLSVLVLTLLALVLSNTSGRVNDAPQQAPARSAPAMRPKAWFDVVPAPGVPDRKGIAAYRHLHEIAEGAEHESEPDLVPASGEMRNRIGRAVAQILASSEVPDAWAWSEIRDRSFALGSAILIYEPQLSNAERKDVFLGYSMNGDLLLVWPKMIARLSDEDLAELVVHEMTHAVFTRRLLATIGISATELAVIIAHCGDISINLNFATEAMAFYNQACWGMTRDQNDQQRRRELGELVTRAVSLAWQSRTGRAETRRRFAELLRDYALSEFHQTSALFPEIRPAYCGPFVAARDSKVFYVYPSDLAPERIVPLMDQIGNSEPTP